MALPATDDFEGISSWSALSSSASWTDSVAGMIVVNGGARGSGSNAFYQVAFWDDDAFNDNQYSEAPTYQFENWVRYGVAVRCTADPNFYFFGSATSNGGCKLVKRVGATVTEIASGNVPSNGVTLRLEASGTTLTPKIDGSVWSAGAQTDNAIASGSAGVGSFYGGNYSYMPSWEGGNLGGGATSISLSAAALTAGGQATTLTPGATSTDLAAAAVTASGPALTVSPGAVSITLASGAASAAGQALTVAGGAVSTSLNDAAVTTSGPALTVAPGAVSVSLSAAEAGAAGQALSVTNVSIPTLTAVQVGVAIHLEFALP